MKRGALWPWAIGAVLGVTVLANVAVWIVADGRGAAVVAPDYYHRAVAWDSTRAVQARSDSLLWRLDAELGPLDRGGTAALRLRLEDRDGAPVEGARARVTALHNAWADRPVTAELAGAGDGSYAARLPLVHPGVWELSFEVTRGEARFLAVVRRELSGGPR